MSGSREISGGRRTVGGALRAFLTGSAGYSGDQFGLARVDDGLMSRIQLARTVLGLVAAVGLFVAYPLSDGGQEYVLGKLLELGLSCAVLLAGTVIGIAVFLAASTRDRRRHFAARLHTPILAALALALGPFTLWVSFLTLKGETINGEDLKGFFDSITGPGWISSILSFLVLVIGALVAFAVLILSIPYTVVVAYGCVATCFRASDVHQLLPALLAPLLVWALFAFQLFNGPDLAAPPEVLYTFMVGGPLSVTALSVWEVRRLRTHHGITLRVALGR
ncbi:hypothetical protein [Streptomyces sp. NPDC047981]|uniref:hypothetical protein n=1 Tax=Streptomyces sp. NPDC047981 TaxID=3154610 RepID=UPI0034289F30